MEKLQLNKTIYGITKAHDALDEEFTEFIPKKQTLDDLFNMYDSLFYDMIKEGKKNTHFNIVQKSIRYAGEPINLKDGDIEELKEQIQQINEDIYSIENTHPFFPNGSILRSANEENDYYMQSGKRRQLNSRGAFALIKSRAGKKNMDDNDFVIYPISETCIAGMLMGPPINKTEDLHINIMEINRFDDRQFEEEY